MKIIKEAVKEDKNRYLFWTIITFFSEDETRKTRIFVCASKEYLEGKYELPEDIEMRQPLLNEWLDDAISKWSTLDGKIFEKDVHYDVYANTLDGEANGINYLVSKFQNLEKV